MLDDQLLEGGEKNVPEEGLLHRFVVRHVFDAADFDHLVGQALQLPLAQAAPGSLQAADMADADELLGGPERPRSSGRNAPDDVAAPSDASLPGELPHWTSGGGPIS